jgi:peptidoglycan/xylan/chitin deacetylase (PgdA/CDA1 family)/GH35 family endo-1,4-beta-xylanase
MNRFPAIFLALLGLVLGTALADPVKRVALVFDDGPKPADAGPLLELLVREKVRVTFSLVGDRVNESPATARAIADAGHEIANHSQAHLHPKDLADAALDREVAVAQEKITAAAGRAPRWYWPPFLETDDRVRAAAARAGLAVYTPRHLVVSMDYDRTIPAAEIYRRATTDVKDGTVILCHEWRTETREQLPAILAELRRQGCAFLTFSELYDSLAASDQAAAPVAPTALPPGEPLIAGDPLAAFTPRIEPAAQDRAKLEVVEATGPGFTRAWRVATLKDTSPMAAIELRALNARPVAVGDVAMLRFFARATAISDETGGGRVQLVIRRNGVDWNSSFEGDFTLNRSWQEILVPFIWSQEFATDGAALMLRFGFKAQTVEIGGIDAIYYGKNRSFESLPRTRFTYAGREPDAQWRKDALARIERIRKGDFVIQVTGADGKPRSGVKVTVTQKRSAFEWGSALQMERLVVDTPDNLKYRQVTTELFNAASTENDLKWPVWLGEWEGNFSHAQTLRGLHWLQDRGFHLRGHVFVWPGYKNLPKPVQERIGTPRQNEIPALVLDHIREEARATKGLLQEWDVLNEPFTNHDLMDLFGREIMPPWFKVAREELPGVRLVFNDFSNHDATTDADHVKHYEETTRYLLDHGAPVDGLGLQAHFNGRPNAPEHILAVLDRYQQEFHLPVRFTEFDVWTRDEELQADFTRDFLILAYSHPSVVGVQHWGFWETCHWRPSAAMYRADWSEKPNARVYKDLVLHQWRTNLTGTTDAVGRYSARGFQGDYVVTVEQDGKRWEQAFVLRAGEPAPLVHIVVP